MTDPASAASAWPDLRDVHRAVAELRRGAPILLQDRNLLVLAAETAGAEGLRDMASLAGTRSVLLLARNRAQALLGDGLPPGPGGVIALQTPPGLLDPAFLRGLADPTAAQLLQHPPRPAIPPPGSDAALLLTKLARLLPAAIVAEAVPEAPALAIARRLQTVEDAQVHAYPDAAASHLVPASQASVALEDAGPARIVAFRAPDAGIEHLAILIGQPEEQDAPLTRIHSECFTGDLLGSLRCDCGPQLRGAIRRIGQEGGGILLYLAQEGRGIGLVNKLRAYALQDGLGGAASGGMASGGVASGGMDTLDANHALGWGEDERDFRVAATMLRSLGVFRVRLLTNNPAKVAVLASAGIQVAGREPHAIQPNGVNDAYLATKAHRFGHLFD